MGLSNKNIIFLGMNVGIISCGYDFSGNFPNLKDSMLHGLKTHMISSILIVYKNGHPIYITLKTKIFYFFQNFRK